MLKKVSKLILPLVLITVLFGNDIYFYINKKILINRYFNNKSDYLGVIEVPKINLQNGFYDYYSPNNNVSKNIMFLYGSNTPDETHGNLMLASHSGLSKIAYFKNLNKLNIGDEAIIYYNGEKYKYYLDNVYQEDKDGYLEINRIISKNTLTLVTCDKNNNTLQNVYIFYGS